MNKTANENNQNVFVLPNKRVKEEEQDIKLADFEEAISAAGLGKFNVFVILVTIPLFLSNVFETVSISYVLPVAQCDLHLTLEDKGMLNAVTFAGMITSGFFWGYLCDSFGRKKIISYGYLLNGFFVLMGSFSSNITIMMVAKFFSGLVINGPYAATTSYLSELHSAKYRARVQMIGGIILSAGNTILPLMAWGILPRSFDYLLFGYIDFHSWNLFLIICALAPISGGIAFLFMPESPKFLMSSGRNEEALKVFRRVYRINTGKPAKTYPIKYLIEEKTNVAKKSTKETLQEGIYQMKPLFCAPNILKLLLACLNAHLLMMGTSTLKLWLPQLFQSINDYEFSHNGASSNLCEMLEDLSLKNVSSNSTCVVNLNNTSVYINAMLVGISRIIAFGMAGSLVNILGKKKLTIIMAIIGGLFSIATYFSQNSETVLILSCINLAFGSVCENVIITITLELFPTTLRTVALSLHMIFGRLGIIIGNIIFPILLYAGCAPPFIFIGLVIFGCALLSFLYPNTENKPLQ